MPANRSRKAKKVRSGIREIGEEGGEGRERHNDTDVEKRGISAHPTCSREEPMKRRIKEKKNINFFFFLFIT